MSGAGSEILLICYSSYDNSMEWSTKNIVVIIGLILTIVSIISPITWDYYTHRSD